MNLKELYFKNSKKKNPVISFEIFPPKNDEDGEKFKKLLEHLTILKKYNPAFISITYGAGGTTQTNSLGMIKQIENDLGFSVMPHFTCVCASKAKIKDYLVEIESMGIRSILALRGDIPEGVQAMDFDFHYANELVEFIKAETNLSIGVAGYPEGHIDCEDIFVDLDNLKRKVDAGSDAIFTQMVFDNDKFFRFVDRARAAGIVVPIIPGILPVTSYSQMERMLSMAKVVVPSEFMNKLEKYKDNTGDTKKIGIEFASVQCQQLIESEVSGLHFYTLNKSSAVSGVLDNLSIAQVIA
jgi:methylenetetrahydrofolate reductase (NADPH)